jgi:hypothetical protein
MSSNADRVYSPATRASFQNGSPVSVAKEFIVADKGLDTVSFLLPQIFQGVASVFHGDAVQGEADA